MKAVSLKTDAPPAPPVHVAIIMDGNGRWAKARGLPRTAGHKRGAESVKVAVEAAAQAGVGYLTLFGFSSENWKRSPAEITDLMGLLRHYLKTEVGYLNEHGIRLRVIGERHKLAPDIVKSIEQVEHDTAGNRSMTLIIALSYGGRAEIAAAARRIARRVATGSLDLDDIDERVVEENLFTVGIPDPDVLIRTSGEKRISNFLLWQLAYAEFVFIDTLWPDFAREDFDGAVREYHRRDRRYGTARA